MLFVMQVSGLGTCHAFVTLGRGFVTLGGILWLVLSSRFILEAPPALAHAATNRATVELRAGPRRRLRPLFAYHQATLHCKCREACLQPHLCCSKCRASPPCKSSLSHLVPRLSLPAATQPPLSRRHRHQGRLALP